jgi:hypothetical protein
MGPAACRRGVVPEDPRAGGDGERGLLGEVEDALGGGLDDGVLRAVDGGDTEQRADENPLAGGDASGIGHGNGQAVARLNEVPHRYSCC